MGTRSTTYVLDEDSHVLVCIYEQYDGYPNGVGRDIAAILTAQRSDIPDDFKSSGVTVDGKEIPVMANNGMDCLAASLVRFRKEKPLGVYLYPVPFIRKLDFYTDGRVEIVGSLAEHARRNGSDYMYIVYHDKGTGLHNMLCYYLHEHDMSAGVQYGGPVYKFYEYLEEQKRKAEDEANKLAQPVAHSSAGIIPGEFADIEMIAMPEYD